MTNITVKIDSNAVRKSLGDFGKQTEFAVNQAINNSLVTAQQFQLSRMAQAMTIRKPAFAKRSVKITFSTKATLSGRIAIQNPGGGKSVFEKLENGTPKTAAGHRIAIPSLQFKPKAKLLPASKRPTNLKGKFFSADGKSLMVRKGKGSRAKIILAFSMRTSTRTPRLLHFHANVEQSIHRTLTNDLNASIARAIATAKLQ